MSKMSKVIAGLGVVAALGVAALPMASYAADKAITVNASIDDSLSLTVDKEAVSMSLMNGGAIVTDTVTATVSTNSLGGYTLTAKGTDLAGQDTISAKTIPAGVPTQGTSAWGVSAALTSGYKGLSAQVTLGGSDVAAHEEDTVITFGASANATQEAGSYRGTATLTATAQ